MHGVEAQQMGVGLDRAEIVDADDFDVVAAGLDDGAQHVAADAAEAVDGNPDGHVRSHLRCGQPGKGIRSLEDKTEWRG